MRQLFDVLILNVGRLSSRNGGCVVVVVVVVVMGI